MAVLDIASGQKVTIPAIQLTNGKIFAGEIRASDGQSLVVDLSAVCRGNLPTRVDEMCVMTWEADGAHRSCPILIRSHTQRSMVAQVVIQERRESPRMRIDMTLSYEKIVPSMVKTIAEEVMARVNTVGEGEPTDTFKLLRKADDDIMELHREIGQLREMMADAIARIDALTSIVTGHELPGGREHHPMQILNISSTGVGFLGTEQLHSGDYLRLHMEVKASPRTVIDCMGVVVRCTPMEVLEGHPLPRYDVGVRYTHIHETDRESLIHYLFKVQRRLLRDLKGARLSMAEQA
jgi:hypothetical protein